MAHPNYRPALAAIARAMLLLFFSAGVAAALTGFSADDFRDEDNAAAEELAAFPADERRAALIVAGYPDELVAIQKLQQYSSDEFASIISPFPRKDQEQIWSLVRHPNLAADLTRGGKKSTTSLEKLAEHYPEEDRAAIVREGRDHYPTWVKIHALDLDVETSFTDLVSHHSDEVQSSFNTVADRPELMSLLIDNMHMTTLLGALYRDDPRGVSRKFDTLHAEVTAKRQERERAWAEELADPEAAEELEYAAREFAREHDYDIDRRPTTVRVEHHYTVSPYPFWFGYPVWYDVAYWYPRPYWGHVGFYFGSHGHHRSFISVGLPSLFFLHWYHGSYATRHHPRHHSRWGRGNHAHRTVRYYDNHRPRHRIRHHRARIADRRSIGGDHHPRARHADRNFRERTRRVAYPSQQARLNYGRDGDRRGRDRRDVNRFNRRAGEGERRGVSRRNERERNVDRDRSNRRGAREQDRPNRRETRERNRPNRSETRQRNRSQDQRGAGDRVRQRAPRRVDDAGRAERRAERRATRGRDSAGPGLPAVSSDRARPRVDRSNSNRAGREARRSAREARPDRRATARPDRRATAPRERIQRAERRANRANASADRSQRRSNARAQSNRPSRPNVSRNRGSGGGGQRGARAARGGGGGNKGSRGGGGRGGRGGGGGGGRRN